MITAFQVAYHRNGVMGCGFHVVSFTETGCGHSRHMVGVVFPEPGHVAVFDRKMLGAGQIEFGVNSWRGDVYERDLRDAIAAYNREREAEIADVLTTDTAASKALEMMVDY